MGLLGKQNRFGGKTFDPFTTVNDEFNRQFRVGPPSPGPNLSSGRKNCKGCKKYRPMAGGSNKGGVFLCATCRVPK